ncbi:MAG: hypothetical protein SV253_07120 [Halobacteria archaeon]|nr:hypothetical protein [Halobacteria archaeon]
MAQASQSQPALRIDEINILEWVAVVTAFISGSIHLVLAPGVMDFSQTMGMLFLTAGIGYYIGIAWFMTRYWNRYLYLVAALLTVIQIVMWVRGGMHNIPFAVPDKLSQVIFIGAALYLFKQES